MRILDKTDDRHYDAWLQLNVLSLTICNMNCVYCFKNPNGKRADLSEKMAFGFWDQLIKAFKMSPVQLLKRLKLKLVSPKSTIHNLNVPDLLRSLDNANKIFRISFTGGDKST